MSSVAFTTLTSRAIALPVDDVDTDQIIPARFLTTTTKSGLADLLFADWRARDGFPLEAPGAPGAEILVAGHNFGCGSSREHAVWALTAWGFRAVVATSFADIFRANALKNGLLPVELDPATHATLLAAVKRDPTSILSIDLDTQTLLAPDVATATFPIDPFAKRCLLRGVDELGLLLSYLPQVEAYEAERL